MNGFVKRVTAFLVLQIVLFALFWRPNLPDETNYLAATLDKHERLRATPSPRIVLVGGSNLAFGIDSDLLRDDLGLNVVNMGLNAALGIQFMLDEVESELRPGDVILLSFEHDIFSSEPVELLVRQVVEIRPSTFLTLPRARWIELVDQYGLSMIGGYARRNILKRFDTVVPAEADPLYRRELFDERGSYTGHYGKPSTYKLAGASAIKPISEGVLKRLVRFAERCRELNALCIYSCPPHPEALLAPATAAIGENLRALGRVPGLLVLDTPIEHAYATELFYDTSYHLTREGAQERTRRLAAELAPVFVKAEVPVDQTHSRKAATGILSAQRSSPVDTATIRERYRNN